MLKKPVLDAFKCAKSYVDVKQKRLKKDSDVCISDEHFIFGDPSKEGKMIVSYTLVCDQY